MNGYDLIHDCMLGVFQLRLITTDDTILFNQSTVEDRWKLRRRILALPRAGGIGPEGFEWREWSEVIAIDEAIEYELTSAAKGS